MSAHNTPATAGVPASSFVAPPAVNPPGGQRPPAEPRDIAWVWDLPFDRLTMDAAVDHLDRLIRRGQPSFAITANLNYAMLHHRDPAVAAATADAAMVLADGQPIVLRSRLTGSPLPQRVAGSELIYRLAAMAAANHHPIYFLGGNPGVARRCADELTRRNPTLLVAGVESPPFRPLTPAEQAEQTERIRTSGAKILLVALGQPKGELWVHQHYRSLGIPLSIQLGASFDFVTGDVTRAPDWCQKLGIEWLHRALSDPRRLAPRYAANAFFLAGRLINDWQSKVRRWGMNPNA